jgi:hypothetical protein
MASTNGKSNTRRTTREPQLPCGCNSPHPPQLNVYMCHPGIQPVFSCPFCSFWTYDAAEARSHAWLDHVQNTVRTLRAILKRA